MLQKPTVIWFSAILLSLLTASFHAAAQYVPNYTFSQSQSTYTSITGGTVYASGTNVDDATYSVALPFNFVFDGTAYNQIYISTNGFISFGLTNPGLTNYFPISSTNSGFEVVSGFGYNLNSLDATTELSAQTLGIAPNQTYVIQWKNFSYSISSGITYNFQIRLNQTTNTIDIVYGSMTTVLNTTTGQIGLRGLSNTSYNNRSSSFGWTSTTSGSANSATVTFSPSYEPSSGLTFSWAPPPACNAPQAQPTSLQLTPNTTSITGTFTPAVPAATGYLVVMTPGTASLNTSPVNGTTYTVGNTLGNGTVISVSSGSTFSNTGLTQSTDYTYTIFDYNNGICIGGPVYDIVTPFTASIETLGPKSYTWLATSGQADWQNAASWSPARTIPNVGDTLLFSNGGTSTAINIPTQQVNAVEVTGNTNVSFNSAATNTLTIGKLLSTNNSTALTLGPNPLTVAFATGTPMKTASINGTIDLRGKSIYNAANTVTTINNTVSLHDTTNYNGATSTTIINGVLNLADTSIYTAGTSGTTTINNVANLTGKSFFNVSNGIVIINDTVNDSGNARMYYTTGTVNTTFSATAVYNHARDGGYIPPASFNAASTVNITGIVSTPPTLIINQSFGNLIWNCAGQSTAITTSNPITTIQGQLSVINTGTYTLKLDGAITVNGNFYQQSGNFQLAPTTYTLKVLGNITLSAGTLDLDATTGTGTSLTVNGNLTQNVGHFITKSGTGMPTVNFNGTSYQNINFNGTVLNVPVNYILNNISGAAINGVLPVVSNATNTILNGSWTGSGMFTYTPGTSSLIYSTSVSQASTPQEWPAVNGPANVTINQVNVFPYNRIYMPGSRTLTSVLTITKGVLVLGSSDLTIDSASINTLIIYSPDSTKMIAADGGGRLIRKLPSGSLALSFEYPVGSISVNNIPEFSPVSFLILAGGGVHHIGVKVTDTQHPDDNSTTNYISRYWSMTDDNASTPFSYKIYFNYPYSDIVGTYDFKLNSWNGSAWTEIPSSSAFSLPSSQDAALAESDTFSSVQYPIQGKDFTGRTGANNVYTWNGSVSTDYQVAANWTPNRFLSLTSDILQFNNGISDTVTDIATDTVTKITVTNNTIVVMQAQNNNSVNAANLAMYSDHNTGTNELQIDSGSAIYSNGTYRPLIIAFAGDSCTANISGRLEMVNTSQTNKVSVTCTGCVLTVAPQGTLAAGTTNNGLAFTQTDSNNIIMYGTYEHKYTTVPGYFPNVRWMPGSVFNIKGYTTATGGPVEIGTQESVNFSKLFYNCPSQTSSVVWYTTTFSVRDSLIMTSTGSGMLRWDNVYTYNTNNYLQTGGTLDINDNYLANDYGTFNINGAFSQTGGTIYSSATLSASVLNFCGATGTQNVSFYNASPAGPVTYAVSNPSGINLSVIGTPPSYFDVNNIGGVKINVPLSWPIISSLPIRYNGNTTLSYMCQGNCASDTLVYPALNSPYNVYVSCGTGNLLTMPGSRIVPGVLTLQNDIDMGANNLTVGTSATSTGTLTPAPGYVRLTTGSLTRWFGTASLPTAPNSGNTGIGVYPVSYNGYNRTADIYFSTATALYPGGSITVSHANNTGLTTSLNVVDGSYTINDRTNASWSFLPGNGITLLSSSVGILLTGGHLLPGLNNSANLRAMQANGVVGTYVAGAGTAPDYTVQRSGLALTDLSAGPYYIGMAASEITGDFISVKSGSWQDGTTWNTGTVPGVGNRAFISEDDTVTINGSSNAKSVFVEPHGTLMADQSTLSVDSSIVAVGTFEMNGGIVTLGPIGGGKQTFLDSGIVDMYSGTLNVNGNLKISTNGSITQIGGDIKIDGNAAGVTANSVPSGTPLLFFNSGNLYLTGGNITIVDPHAANPSVITQACAVYFSSSYNVIFGPNHSMIFGDGVSATPGGDTSGFYLYCPAGVNERYRMGNVIINSTPGIANREVMAGSKVAVYNLTLNNAGAEFRFNSNDLHIAGNLTVNANALLNENGNSQLFFDDFNSSTGEISSTVPQVISGSGTMTSPYGTNLGLVQVNNTSSSGVTCNVGDISMLGLSFTHGLFRMANGSTLNIPSGGGVELTNQSTGWVIGKVRLPIPYTGSYSVIFPLGDSITYTPVTVTATSSTSGFIRMSITETDNPNIATSPVNALKSVNRYYTIDTTGTFSPQNFSILFTWAPYMVDTGAIWTNFISAVYNNNNWTGLYGLSTATTSLQLNGLGNYINGNWQIGENKSTPIMTLQPLTQNSCSGASATFTVSASLATGYQWQVNDGTGWMNTQNNVVYSGSASSALLISGITTAMNNYQYRCLVSNNIGTDTSAAAALNVNISVTPVVSINASSSNICLGTSVSFTATPTNGGTTPTYQWKKNGTVVGANSPSYTDNALANSDAITCTLNSSISCAVPAMATSSTIIMTVNPVYSPSLTVASTTGSVVCAGTTVPFTTTTNVLNGTYQWSLNSNSIIGATNSTYSYVPANNDYISCNLTTPVGSCYATSSAASNTITVTVNAYITPTVSITGNTAMCSGFNDAFTASTNITGATYQWQVNSLNSGSNSSGYTYQPVNNDIVRCILTMPAGCYTASMDTSNSITMTVTPSTIPTVTITCPADTVCAGSTQLYTATTNITGATYQWLKNGSAVGTNSNTYSYTPANGDAIKCVLTMPSGCFTENTDTSNIITMTVNPVITPSLTITGSSSLCQGTTVTYNLTSNIAMATYQWQVDGSNVGSGSTSYTYVPVIGDQISCVLTVPPTGCFSVSSIGDTVSINVSAYIVPTVSVTPSSNNICVGTADTFHATTNIINTSYQWQVNSGNMGMGSSYIYTPANGDFVRCIVTAPAGTCYLPMADTGMVTMQVNPYIIPVISISGPAAVAVGNTVTVNATISNAGSNYTVNWKNNGVIFSTTATPIVTYTKSQGTDVITAVVNPQSPGCYDSTTSNMADVNVDNTGVGNVSGADMITAYPNPFNNEITVLGLSVGDQLCIYDMTGKKVSPNWVVKTEQKKNTFNIFNLSPGSYIMRVCGEKGDAKANIPLKKLD